MKSIFLFCALAALGAGTLSAQTCLTAPSNESFDASGALPAGWSDGGGTRTWSVNSGATGSSNTGPSADHTSGSGNYVYMETSSPVNGGDTFILVTPCYDITGLGSPALEFWTHMYGRAIGTLTVEQSDGLGGWTQIWTLSGDQGDQWDFRSLPITPTTGQESFRFIGTAFSPPVGSVFEGDIAIDDVAVKDQTLSDWQSPGASFSIDIDGQLASAFFPAKQSAPLYQCTPTVPVDATFNLGWTDVTQVWDIAFSSVPTVPAMSGAGAVLANGDYLNIDFSQPLMFLSTGNFNTIGQAVPGSTLPGATGPVNVGIPLQFSAPALVAAQGYVTDPTSAIGISLTQAAELDVVSTPIPTSVAGPTAVSTNVTIELDQVPTCWIQNGVPFYGTRETTMYVSPNGFLAFGGGGDTDGTPSVSDALSDDGRVGFWTNFDPSEGGVINITNPAPGMIAVDYVGVFYNGGGPGNTFSISIDEASGVIQIDGLQGIVANSGTSTSDDQWLGISRGLGVATDPGASAFMAGGAGSAGNANDMLYEFNDASTSGVGLLPSIGAGMNTLVLIPNAFGNYDWAGF